METPIRFAPANLLIECPDPLAEKVIGCGIRIHRFFGPGQFERIYKEALRIELVAEGLAVQTEVPIEVKWRGEKLGVGFRADMLVNDCLVLELKCVDTLLRVHESQLMGYLRLMRIKTGLLMNFRAALLREGIRRKSI